MWEARKEKEDRVREEKKGKGRKLKGEDRLKKKRWGKVGGKKGGKWKGKRNWRGGNGMEITKTKEESKGKGHARKSRQCSVPNFGV